MVKETTKSTGAMTAFADESEALKTAQEIALDLIYIPNRKRTMTEELKEKFRPIIDRRDLRTGLYSEYLELENTTAAALVCLEFALELFRDKNRSSTGTMIELEQQIEQLKP